MRRAAALEASRFENLVAGANLKDMAEDEASTIERALVEYFAERAEGIDAAYLFGSVARGDFTAESDVDVAVLLAGGAPKTLSQLPTALEGDLTEVAGRPVQVVVLNDAPVDLVHRVLRDGHLLHQGNPSRRIAFEVRARNEYFDLKPFLDRYRRAQEAR